MKLPTNPKNLFKTTLLAALLASAGLASAQVIPAAPYNPAGTYAAGPNAQATGTGQYAWGYGNGAVGLRQVTTQNSTAFGLNALASATGTTSVGTDSSATAKGATAFGSVSQATGLASTSFGTGTLASGDYSLAGGLLAQSGATNSVALGSYSITSGFSGVAVGSSASATNGTAIGMASTASNGGSALGFGSTATNSSVALGGGATATGYNSVAIGNLSTAEEDNTVSLGSSTFGITRRVTNMADGINDSDGATVRQVNVVAAAAANAQSTADYAVSGVSALNANLYSTAVTIGANAVQVQGAVSFGDGAGNNLKLTNIANGVVAAGSSDAVTGDQLNTTNQAVTKAQTTADTAIVTSGQALAIAQQTQAQVKVLTGRVDALDGRVTSLESRMDGYDRRINGGVAISSAMNAAVAPSLAPGESALLGGVGSFKGQAALSMGIAHTNYAGQSFTAKVSTSSIGTAFALGGAVKF